MSEKHKRADDILYVNSDGTKAKIAFIWGKKKDPIPQGLDITIKRADHSKRDLTIHCNHKNYRSLAQARTQGMMLAEGVIDLLSQPLD